MNTIRLALLTGLALLAGPAFADQSDGNLQHQYIAREISKPFYYVPAAPAATADLSGISDFGGPVIKMATYRVNDVQFPTYAVLKVASTQIGLLEPCALVKKGVSAKRRYDFFLAPVALSNGAAGFGIMRVSW